MKLPLYTGEGKKNGTMDVSDMVFGTAPKAAVVHQVYLALESNTREPWAHTKDRGEVRGGGKKPWKQKGTGRARHGSIRSPLWVGGGRVFGPRNVRNYKQKINKKMNQLAVRMCLTSKVQADQFFTVEKGAAFDGKTKQMATLRNALPGAGKSTVFVVAGNQKDLGATVRNIPNLHMQRAEDLNVADLMHHEYVIATAAGVQALEKRLV